MRGKTPEYTADLFTKSESRTEDLIEMIDEVQMKYTHKFKDEFGKIRCFERKVISGDNKTEKNSHHGILRYSSPPSRNYLSFNKN